MRATYFGPPVRPASIPGTLGLIGAIALVYLIGWFSEGRLLALDFALRPDLLGRQPWGILTYPLASVGNGSNLIWVALLLFWFWQFGATVERELGLSRYLMFFSAATLIGGLAHVCGAALAFRSLNTQQLMLFGPAIPISAITLAWGVRHAAAPITLFFVIPVTGIWVAYFSAAFAVITSNSYVLAPFALIPMALAWLYASDRLSILPWGGSHTRRETKRERQRSFEKVDNAIDRQKERAEKERLRQIFERSLIDDPEDKR